MPTIRLSGTITARSPIMITRPEQNDRLLTMNVVRNESMSRVHAIPGETIKGLLRGMAYAVCVDAGRGSGELKVTLDAFYRQTAGGLTFSSNADLGSDVAARVGQPLLSLFGAATPRLTGRIIVHHALAQENTEGGSPVGMGLPPGTRRDGITAHPQFADLIGPADRALWSRQNASVSALSEVTQRIEDAKRILGRARRTPGVDIAPLEVALATAEKDALAIKDAPEFQHSVQRPLPLKNAAPAGTTYDHAIEVADGTPEEIGLLLAAMELWNQSPRIGGGRTTGYGQIVADYLIETLTDAPLRRHRTWIAAGTTTINGEGCATDTVNPMLLDAMETWSRTEKTICTTTKIFS